MNYIYCREAELNICERDICCGACPKKNCPTRCRRISINCGSLTDEVPEEEYNETKTTYKRHS